MRTPRSVQEALRARSSSSLQPRRGARSASCPHISLLSPSCCCTPVIPFLQPALSEHTQRRSELSSGCGRAVLERLELL